MEEKKELILELLKNKKITELSNQIKECNPADIALFFDDIPSDEDIIILFRILPKELAAETFVDMDPDMQELLIKAFSDKEL